MLRLINLFFCFVFFASSCQKGKVTEYTQYLNHNDTDFPEAKATCNSILAIPLYPEIKKNDQEYVIEKIKEFFDDI